MPLHLKLPLLMSLALGLCGCGSDSSGSGSSTGGLSSGGTSSGGTSSGGTSSGGTSSGGTSSGGTSSGGTSSGGTSSGGTSSGGTSSGGGGGAAGTCAGTPGQVQCGSETCDLKTQYCCGGPKDGKCFALGAFCGLGGGIRMECDDKSDCGAGEECCVAQVANPGSDAPYRTHCVKAEPQPGGDLYGCGTTPGGFPWSALCACDADCSFGSCKTGSIDVPTSSAEYARCQ